MVHFMHVNGVFLRSLACIFNLGAYMWNSDLFPSATISTTRADERKV